MTKSIHKAKKMVVLSFAFALSVGIASCFEGIIPQNPIVQASSSAINSKFSSNSSQEGILSFGASSSGVVNSSNIKTSSNGIQSSSSIALSSSLIQSSGSVISSSSLLSSSSSVVSTPNQGIVAYSESITGSYCPNNITVVWVTTSSGTFVRTVNVQAGQRIRYLSAWESASSQTGLTSGSKSVDGWTGATRSSESTNTATWNLLDLSGKQISNGAYVLHFESTCSDQAGPNYAVNFSYAGVAGTQTLTGNANFSGISIQFK